MTPKSDDIVRFGPRARIEHAFMILAFVLLSLTGLPQKFADAGWAQALVALFGGVDVMRTVHRVTGFLMVALVAEHLIVAAWSVATRRCRPSMMVTRQDFHDAADTLRYYLGLREHEPRFDRYDYKQKFEYWGLVMGSAIMIVSGLILYFPVLTVSLLPGVVIPAAKVAHSNEAMLALLTIVTWHLYSANLNPEVFPIDKAIFTGRISRERMLREHPVEYERLLEAPDVPADLTAQPEAAESPAAAVDPAE